MPMDALERYVPVPYEIEGVYPQSHTAVLQRNNVVVPNGVQVLPGEVLTLVIGGVFPNFDIFWAMNSVQDSINILEGHVVASITGKTVVSFQAPLKEGIYFIDASAKSNAFFWTLPHWAAGFTFEVAKDAPEAPTPQPGLGSDVTKAATNLAQELPNMLKWVAIGAVAIGVIYVVGMIPKMPSKS